MKRKQNVLICLTVMLIDGGRIEVVYPEDIAEEFFAEMTAAVRSGEPWHVGANYDVRAEFAGTVIESINTRLIVGWR